MPIRLTKAEILRRANLVHPNKFIYPDFKYINKDTKIEIICPEHGSFWQSVSNHLRGRGCPDCALISKRKKLRLGNEVFISRAKKIHKIYDYERVKYKNSLSKVEIICPEHGSFWQRPNDHLQGHGCPKCALNIISPNLRSFDDVTKQAKKVHLDKYTYVGPYENMRTKTKIICPEHGSFWQSMEVHVSGHGCPLCARFGFQKNKPAFLYYFEDLETGLYKIGITNNEPQNRFKNRKKIRMIFTKRFKLGEDAFQLEQKILRENTNHRVKNQNFKDVGGYTEFFDIDISKYIEEQMGNLKG